MSFVGTVVFDAGSRVNLLEGPNGSGKSSVVTALCMGLAGSIKAMNRQAGPEELIRRGCAAFEVEITLSGGPGEPDIVVKRKTEASSGGGRGVTTEWRIDGQVVPEARVKKLTQSLGLHFDNLCIFLPQERVAHFTDMTSTQLLESTEESIGNGELLRQHKELTRLSAELKTKREEVQRTRDRLARVESEQSAAKPEYDRLQRRNALKQQINRMKQKQQWLEKERCAQHLQEAQESEAAEQDKVSAAREELRQATEPFSDRQRRLQDKQREVTALAQAVKSKDAAAKAAVDTLRHLEGPCNDMGEALIGLTDKSKQWRESMERLRQDLQRAKEEQQGLPTELTPQQVARLQRVPQEAHQAATTLVEIRANLREKEEEMRQTDVRLKALEAAERQRTDRPEQRLLKLENAAPGSKDLYQWLNEMRQAGRFRRRVLGPVLMTISSIADPNWAAYVEQLLSFHNLAAVVVEDIADNNMIQDWLNEKAALPRGRGGSRAYKNKILLVGAPGAVQYPNGPASQYAQYGVTHTVDQLFEAPDLVKAALVDTSGINTAYVAGSEAEGHWTEMLLANTPVRRLFTPSCFTSKVISQYDRNYQSYRIDDVRPPRLLADDEIAGNPQDEQRQAEELRKTLGELAAAVAELASRSQALEATKQERQNELRRLTDERNQIEIRRAAAARNVADIERRLARHPTDPAQDAEKLRRQLKQQAEEVIRKAAIAGRAIKQQLCQQRQAALVSMELAEARASLQPLKQVVERAQSAVETAQARVAAARQAVTRAQERLQESDTRAREMFGARGPSAQLRAAWAEWPNDAAGLEQLLASKQAEMEQAQAALRSDEAAVLEAWARRDKEMTELRQQSTAGGAEVDGCAADLEDKQTAWLPVLRERIGAINESVVRHFKSIGCAGEVVLREAGDAFDRYAAEIRVKYRPTEPLRALDSSHHSGGERSVATMVYLMALQGVTTTPFRVVDEINQGMDSRNERKIFNLLVECSSRPDTPQCFLLTPKLISNLRYNDHVRVLCLKYAAAGTLRAPQAELARMQADAEKAEEEEAEGADAGAAAAASAPRRRANGSGRGRDPRAALPQRGLTSGELPWACETVKDTLFFGRTALKRPREA